MQHIEITDRTDVLGPAPSPITRCRAGCEGYGLHFMDFGDWLRAGPDRPHVILQQREDGEWEPFPPEGSEDRSLVVECAQCHGTGRRGIFAASEAISLLGRPLSFIAHALDVTYSYYFQLWFPLWAVRAESREYYGGKGLRGALKNLPFWIRFARADQKSYRAGLRATFDRARGRRA